MTSYCSPALLGFVLFFSVSQPSQTALGSAPFEVFPVSDAVRVFEDGYACPSSQGKELRLFALRGEVVSGQCVIRAAVDLDSVSVAVGPLSPQGGGKPIPAANLRANFVTSIFLDKNTRKSNPADLIRPAPAQFPDCLSADAQCRIPKGTLRAVYLTLRVPGEAAPGEYRGTLTVRRGRDEIALPVVVTVYPLTMPSQRHVMVTEWFSSSQFKRHHAVESADSPRYWEILRVYAKNMVEHRQNVFQTGLGLIRTERGSDGKLKFDFADFDRYAQVFWDAGMDGLETGFVAHFGEGGWSSPVVALNSFSVKNLASGKTERVAGADFLPQFLPALVAHLRQKGWLEKTYFHIADEPSSHNIMMWREASDFIHRHAPQLRRLDAIETPHCLGRLEVWCPKLDHLAAWQEAYEAAQRQGNELWLYTVGIFQQGSLPNKTVDVALIESRLLHWLNYRYGLKGYLHWGFNAWTDDPWKAPGKHNGDGWHVYPQRDGLLDSLRWEQMRNGLQDYECLWLLEDRIAQLKKTLAPRVAQLIQPSRRGIEIASRVVSTYTRFSRDPEVLYAARRQAIEEAVDLDVSPRVVFQTIPAEHEPVWKDCGIDVHGWAEPGSEVSVNRHKVPVAADGLFLAQVSPSPEGTITVETRKGGAKKIAVRRFALPATPAGQARQ